MKRIIIPTLSMICTLVTACSPVDSVRPFNQEQAAFLLKENHTFKPSQQLISMTIPHKQAWQRIDVSYQTVGTPIMYVPLTESKNHWTESIRTQIRSYERYPHINATNYFYEEMDLERQYCTYVEGKIILRNANYDLYQLTLANCSNKPDQHHFGKIFNGKDAVYAVYYSWLPMVTHIDEMKQAIVDARLIDNQAYY